MVLLLIQWNPDYIPWGLPSCLWNRTSKFSEPQDLRGTVRNIPLVDYREYFEGPLSPPTPAWFRAYPVLIGRFLNLTGYGLVDTLIKPPRDHIPQFYQVAYIWVMGTE